QRADTKDELSAEERERLDHLLDKTKND
ncbi:MAG: cytochrome c-type biogenesis protein CcmH, partial [Pseudomonas mandelii]